jgi:uncharacterized protein YcfJ
MKRLILIVCLSSGLVGAQAQLFSPEAIGGAFMGTMIGGLAGGNCHNGGFSGNDAAIGAGIGLAAGAILGEVQRQSYYNSQPYYYVAPPPYAQPGYGYTYPAPYVYAPAYAPPPQRPNYAVGGTLVGALAGGLIGAGYGNGWEGAGIGAASGLVLGGAAEYASRKHEQKVVAARSASPPQASAWGDPPAQTSTHQRPPQSPPQAPQLHQAAPRPTTVVYQIPDAPHVPDAPTF